MKTQLGVFCISVDTTARIESSGEINRIHISEDTAALLVAAGKQHWLKLRHDKVVRE